jgi:hypothetical protein
VLTGTRTVGEPTPIARRRKAEGAFEGPVEPRLGLVADLRGDLNDGPCVALQQPRRDDTFVPDSRFDNLQAHLRHALRGHRDRRRARKPDPRMRPHSVLTVHLRDDDPEGPTKRAEQRVIQFFKERTGA